MTEQTFASRVDGMDIFVHHWKPQGPARALLIISHGFKGHGGLYGWAAEQFAGAGFSVYALDHRGHGKSGGERYETEDFAHYITDLDHAVELANTREPGLPTYLLGHGASAVMGGLYAIDNQDKLAGFISESIALVPPQGLIAQAAAKALSHIAPHFDVLDLKNAYYSRDPAHVAALDQDPLIYQDDYPSITVAGLLRAVERLRAELPLLTVPLFIVHGSADQITEHAGSQLLYDYAGSYDKTYKLYEGYYHDLLADEGREVPLGDMISWLKSHATQAPTASV